MRSRWQVILLGLPLYLLTLMVAGTAALGLLIADDWGGFSHDFANIFSEPGWWLGASLVAAVITASQAIFLVPVFQFRRGRLGRGKSLAVSAALLGVVAATLTVGLICGLMELLMLQGTSQRGEWPTPSRDLADQRWFQWFFWPTLIVSWLIWSAALFVFTRRDLRPQNSLGKFVGLLLGGTVVEALAILPIDIMARRRTSCYCNSGTFLALAFSIVAVFWLTGPGMFIALTSKRRRAWYEIHCMNCGYSKGPTPSEKCPACGFEWNQALAKPQAADR